MARVRKARAGSEEEMRRWRRYGLALLKFSSLLENELYHSAEPWGRYELNAALFAVVLGTWPELCCEPAHLDTGRFDEIIRANELAADRLRESHSLESERRRTIFRLIAAGANPRAFNSAVLRLAAAGGLADTVDILMENGADPAAKDCEAFVLAAGNGYLAAARRLVAVRRVPRRRLSDALVRACGLSSTAHVIHWLLEMGADASVDNSAALHLVMARRHRAEWGRPAEHFAAGTPALVRGLIHHGADPTGLQDTGDLRWVAGLVGEDHPVWPKLAAAIMREML